MTETNEENVLKFIGLLVVSFIIMAVIIAIQPVSYKLTGEWNGDIRINKDDPHWGVVFMDKELDKSTSIEVTGVKFTMEGQMPAYIFNKLLGDK